MALFPFVLVDSQKDKFDKVLINHEKIHLYQQIEMLVIPFYIVYLVHYFIQFVKHKKHYTAYMNIVFEKEAYQNEWNLEYLKDRKFWAFWRYWSK